MKFSVSGRTVQMAAMGFGGLDTPGVADDARNPMPVVDPSASLDIHLACEGEPFCLYGNNAAAPVSVVSG